jgi:hypothetical protein
MKTNLMIAALLLTFAATIRAQVKSGVYVPHTNPPKNQSPQNNPPKTYAYNNNNGSKWGGSVIIGWNNYPGYYGGPYYNNNYSYNQLRKTARNSLRTAGAVIHDAVAFDIWNETYSPMLAKAIRHYNYARQLYRWKDFNGALNHAERARYLAWYSLQFFQGPAYNNYGYDYDYPDPYGDPYNPYYKKPNPNPSAGDNSGFKKVNPAGEQGGVEGNKTAERMPKTDEIDKKLPGAERGDQELIKSFKKEDTHDE